MNVIGPEGAPLVLVAYDDLIITNDFTVLPAPPQHTAFQLFWSNMYPFKT